MKISLPYIALCQYKETARKMPVPGNVIFQVECDIDVVERMDAPVVVQIAATSKHPAVDVRHYEGEYYVPAHYDEHMDNLEPATLSSLENYSSHGERLAFVSMLRSIITESHGDYGFNAYQQMFMKLNDADQVLPGWRQTISVDKIFGVVSDTASQIEIMEKTRAAYESNIIIDGVFWRRCEEPRYIAMISNFGTVACSVRVSVEPLTLEPTFDLRPINAFGNEQRTLIFRLDRFDDLEDAIKQYQPYGMELAYDFTLPEIRDSSVLSFNDEAFSLQRNAAAALERGWENLKAETDAGAFAWADLRKAFTVSVGNPDDDNLDALAEKMQTMASTTNDNDVKQTLKNSLKRWEMRPLYVQSHRM